MSKLSKATKLAPVAFVAAQQVYKLVSENEVVRHAVTGVGKQATNNLNDVRQGRTAHARMGTQLDVANNHALRALENPATAELGQDWLDRIDKLRQKVELASVGKSGSSRRATLKQLSRQINQLMDDMLSHEE